MIALGGPTLKLKIDGLVSRTINSLNDSTGRAYTETFCITQYHSKRFSLNDSTGRAYCPEKRLRGLNDSTGRAYTETPRLSN